MQGLLLRLAIVLMGLAIFAPPSSAEPQAPQKKTQAPAAALMKPPSRSTAASEGESDRVARINQWTVGLVGGLIEGTHIHLASDISKVLDDDEEMRVLPIVSHGAMQNIYDLLYLKGVDLAFTHADVFSEFKKDPKIRNIEKRINYISQSHVNCLHILARPEIKSVQDLAGKKVSFHGKGTGVALTAAIVFERLGIKVQPDYTHVNGAVEKLKTGELSALVHLAARGAQAFTKINNEGHNLHYLTVKYSDIFSDYYVPYTLEHEDYPKLIPTGEKVESIAVPAVLAVYNWPKGSDRFRKVERFIQYYFSRFDQLKKPQYQKEWKEINLHAKVPGWTRYWVAEQMLAKMPAGQPEQQGERPMAKR
jgi:TRAP-type uncharacterized transport system substrate-binding protein